VINNIPLSGGAENGNDRSVAGMAGVVKELISLLLSCFSYSHWMSGRVTRAQDS
jgi:hypothetical protein